MELNAEFSKRVAIHTNDNPWKASPMAGVDRRMARDGLVITLEAQERYDDALAEVEPMLGGEGDYFRDQALWHKGRLLEAAGRTDEATEIYRQYGTEYPLDKASLARMQVRARLEELDPDAVPPMPETPMFPGGMGGLGGLGGFGQ